jgi:DNA-binding SARP family transcriptional activator
MSLADDISGEQAQQLAVLYCDLNQAAIPLAPESEIAMWRVNYFRAAREVAADFGGRETTTAAGGWVATFTSTVEALLCARALSSLLGSRSGEPGVSAGLSAGEVTHDCFGISGIPVREAVALCRRANPGQVLIADPLTVVVAEETADSFAAVRLESVPDPVAGSAPVTAIAPMVVEAAVRGRRDGPVTSSRYRRPRRFYRDRDRDRRAAADPGRPPPALRLVTNRDLDQTDPATPTASPGRASGPGGQDTPDRPGVDHLSSADSPDRPELDHASSPDRPDSPDHPSSTDSHDRPDHPDHPPQTRHGDDPHGGPHLGDIGIRLTILGWVTLEEGEPPVRRAVMRGTQARAVLSMLALRRGPVHKNELAELLWPTTLPDHWEGALRGLITKSRRFLDAGGLSGRDLLVGEGGYYELRLPAGVALDRDVATALITAAQVTRADGQPGDAAALARRAATILERRLLAGPDHAWFDQVRAELVRDRLAALDLCARAGLADGAIEPAKRAAAEALEIDPYRESTYRLLMEAHAAAGSRGEALRAYERCRRMLADDLGVAPAAQTQALYIELLG